jgi:electron transport complex protein RnfG
MRQMILALTGVMVLSGLVLASVSGALSPRIEANRRQALARSLSSIFDEVEDPEFTEIDAGDRPIWRAESDGELLGYAVRMEASGYGGPIQLLVGVSPDMTKLLGIAVAESTETPGLGARIQEDSFQNQFEGLDAKQRIIPVKNQEPDPERNEIQALSGATISTNAVVNALNRALPESLDAISTQE